MSDIQGYTAPGAANPAGAIERMVMNKAPLLNTPGTVLPNTLYYDRISCSVNAAESMNYFSRDKIAFSSFSTRTNTSVYIPSVLFTGNCWSVMNFTFDSDTYNTPGTHSAAVYADEGWGAMSIGSIIYYLGSSSVSSLETSGESNFAIAMAACETEEKRRALVRGMGKFMSASFQDTNNTSVSSAHAASELAPLIPNTRIFRSRKSVDKAVTSSTSLKYDAALLQCVTPIRLPFSSMATLDKRLYFDTKLLTQPIQITLALRGFDHVYVNTSNTSDNNIRSKGGNMFLRFSEHTLQADQFELSDKSLSIREELLSAPDFSTGLPFQFSQSMSFRAATDTTTDQATRSVFNLTSLLNADLTTMYIQVREVDDDPINGKTDSTKNSRANAFKGCELRNIKLRLNGQIIFSYDQDIYEITKLPTSVGRFKWGQYYGRNYSNTMSNSAKLHHYSAYESSGGEEKGDSFSSTYIYELNFARIRALAAESFLQNTGRFTNQTFQMEFDVADTFGNYDSTGNAQRFISASEKPRSYQAIVTYLYNACFLVGGDGGNSKLITA